MKRNYLFLTFSLIALLLTACSSHKDAVNVTTPTPAVSPTVTASEDATSIPTPIPTSVPTAIPTPTPSDSLHTLGYTPMGILLQENTAEISIKYIYLNTMIGWKAECEALGMFHEDITLSQTLDGGVSWTKLTSTLDENFTIPNTSESGLIFTDNQNGWITTETPKTGFIGLYRTVDGGTTWALQNVDIPKAYSEVEFMTYPPVFFTTKDALLLTNTMEENLGPLVYVTHDSGDSWTPISEDEDSMLQWKYSTQSPESLAAGWNIQYNGTNWSTENAITWKQN